MTRPSERLQRAASNAGYTTECDTRFAEVTTKNVETQNEVYTKPKNAGLGDKLPLNLQLEGVAGMSRLLEILGRDDLVLTDYNLDRSLDSYSWERVTLTTPKHEVKFTIRTHIVDPAVNWPITK